MFDLVCDAITFCFGFLCSIQSAYLIWYFTTLKRQQRLRSALSWMLVGEFLTGVGTLSFSTLALFDLLGGIPGWIQNIIRIVMFAAIGVSSWHLRYQIRKIENDA